ncbi:hypothetical protein LSM04_009360 [Trypanosoma melophagium]|uniref:uncharacterized protein n=1 Tax=Trypanosoma melophagium TaxID=715481 RepID=UPI00351A1476|nr:hypothetical protein LSM04_009360 [Trypanosoma melophagium]
MYGGGSECRLESADVQHSEPQRDSDMSSDDTLIAAEQDKRYASSIETCRTAIRSVRAAFKCHYAAVEKAIHDKAPYAITAALLVLSRLVANILSLLLPPAAREVKGFTEPDYCCRERSTSIKAIIGRYALRGFTSYGTAPSDHHDAHGLALAEEVLHQIGVPFFADTNLAQPTTVWELLDDEPREAKKNGDEALPAVTSTTQNIRRGFDRAVGLLSAINKIILTSLRDEAVAFSLSVSPNAAQSLASDSSGRFSRMWASKHSDEPMTESCSSGHRATRHPKLFMDGGSLLVWLAEEHGEFRSDMLHNPSVWTFGRLLGFLGKRRFMEQLWDFCLSSYCVVPRCILTAGADDIVPQHHREGWEPLCRIFLHLEDACTRFFAAGAPHDGPRNPVFFRKGGSPAASVLSINSLTHEPDEPHSWAGAQSMGGGATATHSNLEVCNSGTFSRPGVRCVMMKARRSITAGEELRYDGAFVP